MAPSRKLRVVIFLALIAVGYHWLGVWVFIIGIIAFMLYELLVPPPRSRKAPDYMKQAIDNSVGIFGRAYREFEPDPTSPTSSHAVGRNDPCPCGSGSGSGKKYKRCCGRAEITRRLVR